MDFPACMCQECFKVLTLHDNHFQVRTMATWHFNAFYTYNMNIEHAVISTSWAKFPRQLVLKPPHFGVPNLQANSYGATKGNCWAKSKKICLGVDIYVGLARRNKRGLHFKSGWTNGWTWLTLPSHYMMTMIKQNIKYFSRRSTRKSSHVSRTIRTAPPGAGAAGAALAGLLAGLVPGETLATSCSYRNPQLYSPKTSHGCKLRATSSQAKQRKCSVHLHIPMLDWKTIPAFFWDWPVQILLTVLIWNAKCQRCLMWNHPAKSAQVTSNNHETQTCNNHQRGEMKSSLTGGWGKPLLQLMITWRCWLVCLKHPEISWLQDSIFHHIPYIK